MPSAWPRRGRSLCCIAALAATWSCANRAGPSQAVERYLAAIEHNRPEIAYAQLDARLQSQLSWEEFRRRWDNTAAERKQQAVVLRAKLAQSKGALVLSATARDEDGLEISLVHGSASSDEWRISSNPLAFTARTPQEVVRALIYALEQRDYREALKLIAEPTRQALERALEERLAELRQTLEHEIEASGNKAQLTYGTRRRIEFVREQGQWRILDFDLF